MFPALQTREEGSLGVTVGEVRLREGGGEVDWQEGRRSEGGGEVEREEGRKRGKRGGGE